MDENLTALVRRISKLPRGNGRRYPAQLRAQIARAATRLRGRGASWQDVGEQLGIPLETIRGFCGIGGKASRGFVAVEVAESVGTRGIILVCPNGCRVEGLSVEDAADLVRRLA